MEVLKVILTVLAALFALNLLIFVHELGHFWAARWRGMKVDRFAIWFGSPIWKKTINGVDYVLGWIPAGGYVALPQMATMEAIEGKTDTSAEQLPPASPLDKIIVAFAGPLFSFLLALVFAFIVWGVGKPERAGKEGTTIGWVEPGGPAALAGLLPGDKITEVDGHIVTEFAPPSQDSVTWRIVTSEGDQIPVKYLREGVEHTVNITPTRPQTKWYERKSLRKIMVYPAEPVTVAMVMSNSPAEVAGLKTNDQILAIDGKRIFHPNAVFALEEAFSNAPVQPAIFTVKRGTEQLEVTVVAEKPAQPTKAAPSFGLLCWFNSGEDKIVHPRPFDQLKASAGQIFATVKAVTSRKSDVGVQQLGGAVMIIRAYKSYFDSENGWRWVLWFSVVLNVNLAMLNMLPLPVLDGGHIVLSLYEAVRRRPASAKFVELLHTACTVVLITFMLYIAFFDIGDWWRSGRTERSEPIVFTPKH